MTDTLPTRATNRDLETLPFDQALDAYSPNLAEALPDHIPLQRFKRVVITAVNQNPELARADRRSLFNACVTCALDGLYPDGREAVLLTFRTRQKDGTYKVLATYIPMIAGVRKRMRNSGEVLSATSELVHKNDHFRYAHGDHPILEHEPPALDVDRGPVIGAYAIIRLRNGETIREVMSLREIERIRGFSRSADSTDSPWVKHPGQMARKTVLKRAANSAPISAEMEQLFRRDEEAERLMPPPPPPPTREQFAAVSGAMAEVYVSEQTETPTFDVIGPDGVVRSFDDPEDACVAFADLSRDARGDAKAVSALNEDNQTLRQTFIDFGRPDLADEIKAVWMPIPERAAVVELEPKPPEAMSLLEAVDGAGSSSETKARQSAPAAARPDGPVRQETRANPVTHGEAGGSPAPREAPPIQMPHAFDRHADLLANREASTPIGSPPIRNGKPDYRTWRIVLFDAAARKCKTVEEFATLIGDSHEHIEAHDRALPDQAGPFRAARDARMNQLEEST